MPVTKAILERTAFNQQATLPFELRLVDFELAMQDVYDFFFDVNRFLLSKGLQRLDDMLRPANMSGFLSDMITASLAKHSRALTENQYHNGHPDLVVRGRYADDSIKAGDGVEIKTTRKRGGAVDTHGARNQWLCSMVYTVDNDTEPASERRPMIFTEVYLGEVVVGDFRSNPRKGNLGTRTATLDRDGIAKFRQNWIYRLGLTVPEPRPGGWRKRRSRRVSQAAGPPFRQR